MKYKQCCNGNGKSFEVSHRGSMISACHVNNEMTGRVCSI